MTSYQWWADITSGAFDDPNNWGANGTLAPPQGPPGPGDEAVVMPTPSEPNAGGITVTGAGTVDSLHFEGAVVASAATLAGTQVVWIETSESDPYGVNSLTLTDGSVLAGPTAAGLGIMLFPGVTLDIDGASSLIANTLGSGGTLLVENGAVTVTTFITDGGDAGNGDFDAAGRVDIGAHGTITDTQGSIAGSTYVASVTVENGGRWNSQSLEVLAYGILAVAGGSTVSIGGATAYPGAPAFTVSSWIPGEATVSVTGAGSTILDANDASIGSSMGGVMLDLADGGTLAIAGTLDADHDMLSNDRWQIGSGSLLHVGSNATLAYAGNITATITAGGTFAVGGTLTAAITSNASASIDLAGGSLAAAGGAVLGVAGTAAVEVGSSAQFSVGGALTVGGAGFGSLDVNAGTLAMTGQTLIAGAGAGGRGTISFENTSFTDSGGTIVIGNAGTGALSLGPGATVSAGELDIGGGTAAGGTGVVAIGATDVLSAAATTIGSTGSLVLMGGVLAASTATVLGAVTGQGGIAGTITNDGTITASGGMLILAGPVASTGTLAIGGGTLDLRQGAAGTQVIQFGTGTDRLQTESLGATAGTIEGFTFGDSILLAGTLANAGTWAGGVLTLDEGATSIGTLAVAGSYTASNFEVSNDGTNTTIEMACFATGTGVATVRGRVAVEDLRVGDRVPTVSGRVAAISWVGHRALDLRRHPHPENVMPVRVHAGAFGHGVPARDLVLSPDHAVLVAGTLIPVRHLINGQSILQETRAFITYWHVELDRHDVLLAEGLACESYLDTGNRHALEGAAALDLHPDFAQVRSLEIWTARGGAAIATAPSDPRLRAAHTALLARAARPSVQKVARLSSVP